MARRIDNSGFDAEETTEQDPLGEDGFAADGFEDAPDGGPQFEAPEYEDNTPERKAGRLPQKMAGIPEAEQHRTNSPSGDRPDSSRVVVRHRGGDDKGDPAVGGTRPD